MNAPLPGKTDIAATNVLLTQLGFKLPLATDAAGFLFALQGEAARLVKAGAKLVGDNGAATATQGKLQEERPSVGLEFSLPADESRAVFVDHFVNERSKAVADSVVANAHVH